MQPAGSFFAYPGASELITLDADETPRFWVTIDTEEDFDWDAPFARTGYRLASVPALAECQGYFERAGVKPIYLVDWPIVTDDRGRDIGDGRAEGGALRLALANAARRPLSPAHPPIGLHVGACSSMVRAGRS